MNTLCINIGTNIDLSIYRLLMAQFFLNQRLSLVLIPDTYNITNICFQNKKNYTNLKWNNNNNLCYFLRTFTIIPLIYTSPNLRILVFVIFFLDFLSEHFFVYLAWKKEDGNYDRRLSLVLIPDTYNITNICFQNKKNYTNLKWNNNKNL